MGLFDAPTSNLLLSMYHPVGYEAGIPGQASWGRGQLGRDYEQMLRDRISGRAPSVAENQLQMGLESQIAAAQSAAAGATGISPGLAMRLSGQSRDRAMAGTNMAAGLLRAQEQAGAEGLLGNLLEARRREWLEMQGIGANQQGLLNQLYMQQALTNAGARGAFQNNLMGGMFNAGGALLGGLL